MASSGRQQQEINNSYWDNNNNLQNSVQGRKCRFKVSVFSSDSNFLFIQNFQKVIRVGESGQYI